MADRTWQTVHGRPPTMSEVLHAYLTKLNKAAGQAHAHTSTVPCRHCVANHQGSSAIALSAQQKARRSVHEDDCRH